MATRRRQRQRGTRPLGAVIASTATRRRIKALLIERFTKAEIARRLGLHTPKLRLDTNAITVRNHLRIRVLYRSLMAEGPGLPLDGTDP